MAERTPLYDLAAQAGASFKEEAGWLMPARYGDARAEYQQARETVAVFDVSHHGRVVLRGPDAVSFLQNLCTNDVKDLRPGREAFLTTHKAKIVAYVRVWNLLQKMGEPTWDLYLDVGPGMAERVIKHLDHFLVSEKVEILDFSHKCAQLHLAGPLAGNEIIGQMNAHPPGSITLQAVRALEPLGLPGYEIFCAWEDAPQVWQWAIERGARPAGLDAYELLRVEAGTPRFGLDMDEDRFAVEVGRGDRAICYTKGCYLGQEPIVMARDRGHVNRTLVGVKMEGTEAISPGAKLFREGTEVGQVTSSVVSPRLGPIALAYVRRGNQEPGTALEVESEGDRRSAVVSALPFKG